MTKGNAAKRTPAKRATGAKAKATKPPREVFRLSQSPSHLLRRAEQFAAELFATSGLHDGVTLRQSVLMAAIAEAEGASQSDLVRITGVDRSTLAEMMARMESRGLIARAAAADDGRAKSVRLTTEGRRKLNAAVPGLRAVDRALLAALPTGQRGAFQTILSGLAEAADVQHATAEAPVAAKPAPRKLVPVKAGRPRVKKKAAAPKRRLVRAR